MTKGLRDLCFLYLPLDCGLKASIQNWHASDKYARVRPKINAGMQS